MSDYENSILSAIEILVDNAVSSATYDKTIIATVLQYSDPTTGKYRLQYQDSTFYAYSTNNDEYIEGTKVYVLIPQGDFTDSNKIILGESTKNSSIIPSVLEESELNYTVLGGNCITPIEQNKIYRISNTDDMIALYQAEGADMVTLNQYFDNGIRECDSLILGCKFRADIPTNNRKGEYGLILGLDYWIDDTNSITEYYTVSSNNVSGNPFKFTNFNRRYHIYNFNSAKFRRVNCIYLYTKGFLSKPVIDFTDIELKCAKSIDNDEINGTFLNFILPQGNTITDEHAVPIIAAPRIDGKILNTDSLNLFYYWFIEDASISSLSEEYSQYGGYGWKCLNEKSNGVFNNLGKQIYVSNDILKSSSGNIKCVVLYGEYKIIKTIKIKNISVGANNIVLTTDNGVTTFHNEGYYIDITCDSTNPPSVYYWSVEDNNGNVKLYHSDLSDIDKERYDSKYKIKKINEANILDLIYQFKRIDLPIELNNGYSSTNYFIDDYSFYDLEYKTLLRTELQSYIEKNDNQDYIKAFIYINSLIEDYNYVTYAYKNKLMHFNTNTITDFSIVKCTTDYGTGSLTLTNSNTNNPLTINNGDQVFQYTYTGVSPADESLDNRIEVKPLTFTFIDENGRTYNDEDMENIESIVWDIPTTNTLLTYDGNSNIIGGLSLSTYGIAKQYDESCSNNQITLTVVVNGKVYTQSTNFTFIKSGEIGTNGTTFTSRIKTFDNDATYFYAISNTNSSILDFNGYLYKNGDRVLDGFKSEWFTKTNTINNTYIPVDTNVIKYTGEWSSPCFVQLKTTVTTEEKDLVNFTVEPIALIEYQDITNVLPITITSGLKYIMYDSGGNNPYYDKQNVYKINMDKDYYLDCSNGGNNVTMIGNSVIEVPSHIDGNTYEYWVDGKVINKTTKEVYAIIHFPIYTYLTKNGLPGLDDWDGNSISLGEDGNILAPQIGAGKKEDDNSFTGALMGIQRESGEEDITGLLGFNHGQRSFLLDADTGGAVFGKDDNGGRIAIDVRDSDAEIYSSNYYHKDSYDNKGFLKKNFIKIKYNRWFKADIKNNRYVVCDNEEDLLLQENGEYIYQYYYSELSAPAIINFIDSEQCDKLIKPRVRFEQNGNISQCGQYVWDLSDSVQTNQQGMRIDLADGKILWGNGQFGVDENGRLTAKQAQVGNWLSYGSYFKANDFIPIIDEDVKSSDTFLDDSIENINFSGYTVTDSDEVDDVTVDTAKTSVAATISSIGNTVTKTKLKNTDSNWNNRNKNTYELNQASSFLMTLQYMESQYIIFRYGNVNKYFAMKVDINGLVIQQIKQVIFNTLNKYIHDNYWFFDDKDNNAYKFCVAFGGKTQCENLSIDKIKILFGTYDMKNIPLYVWNDFDYKNLHNDTTATITPISYNNSNIFMTNYKYIASAITVVNESPVFNISQSGRLYSNNIVVENDITSPGRDSLTDVNEGFRLTKEGLSISNDKYHILIGNTEYPGVFLTPKSTSYIRQLRVGKQSNNSITLSETGNINATGYLSVNGNINSGGRITGSSVYVGTNKVNTAAFRKTSYFARKKHKHNWDDITGEPKNFPTSWNNISGKPSTHSVTVVTSVTYSGSKITVNKRSITFYGTLGGTSSNSYTITKGTNSNVGGVSNK